MNYDIFKYILLTFGCIAVGALTIALIFSLYYLIRKTIKEEW